MFIYQLVIMAIVVAAIYTLAFVFNLKSRKILVVCLIGLVIAGGVGLYAVQYYFSNHFYDQKVDIALLNSINFTSQQKQDIHEIFSDYDQITVSGKNSDAIDKTYNINGNGANSVIDSSIYLFSNEKDADKYFDASQKFYESTYIPLDEQMSKKTGSNARYLISFIKSRYKDYTDLIYLPSKITYNSDIVIQDENVIILLTETANKPVSNKDAVIRDIESKLSKK